MEGTFIAFFVAGFFTAFGWRAAEKFTDNIDSQIEKSRGEQVGDN
jgi:hypothetical protein